MKITLPDYGEVKIKCTCTVGMLRDYELQFKSDPKDAFCHLLEKFIGSKIKPKELSIKDIDALAIAIASKLEIEIDYSSLSQEGKEPYEAFAIVFPNSSYIKMTKQIASSFVISTAALQSLQKPLIAGLPDFAKTMQSIVKPQIDAFQINFAQSFIRQYKNNIHKLHSGILESLFKQQSTLIARFSSLSLSQSNASKAINSLHYDLTHMFQTMKPIIPDLANGIREAKELNALVIESNRVVSTVSDFFRKEHTLRSELRIKERELERDYDNGISAIHDTTTSLIVDAQELVVTFTEKVEDIVDERFQEYEPLLQRMKLLSEPPKFLNLLKEYAISVARNHYKTFWSSIGDKFKEQPEYIAQSSLSLYLEAAFRGVGFVGREIISGSGFVDLLVQFLTFHYILEIKMVGAGWGISWAESGLEQLDNYMQSFSINESYLLVFDGRKTKGGRQLENYYDLPNGRVHVIIVRIFQGN